MSALAWAWVAGGIASPRPTKAAHSGPVRSVLSPASESGGAHDADLTRHASAARTTSADTRASQTKMAASTGQSSRLNWRVPAKFLPQEVARAQGSEEELTAETDESCAAYESSTGNSKSRVRQAVALQRATSNGKTLARSAAQHMAQRNTGDGHFNADDEDVPNEPLSGDVGENPNEKSTRRGAGLDGTSTPRSRVITQPSDGGEVIDPGPSRRGGSPAEQKSPRNANPRGPATASPAPRSSPTMADDSDQDEPTPAVGDTEPYIPQLPPNDDFDCATYRQRCRELLAELKAHDIGKISIDASIRYRVDQNGDPTSILAVEGED